MLAQSYGGMRTGEVKCRIEHERVRIVCFGRGKLKNQIFIEHHSGMLLGTDLDELKDVEK